MFSRTLVFLVLGHLFGAGCLVADEEIYYKIGSRSAPNQFLTDNQGAVDLGSGEGNTAQSNTAYYCDNIKMGRHRTAQLSQREPFFFFINLAVGGNGWPMELSRYNGVIDMYVDWVRVYQGK